MICEFHIHYRQISYLEISTSLNVSSQKKIMLLHDIETLKHFWTFIWETHSQYYEIYIKYYYKSMQKEK